MSWPDASGSIIVAGEEGETTDLTMLIHYKESRALIKLMLWFRSLILMIQVIVPFGAIHTF